MVYYQRAFFSALFFCKKYLRQKELLFIKINIFFFFNQIYRIFPIPFFVPLHTFHFFAYQRMYFFMNVSLHLWLPFSPAPRHSIFSWHALCTSRYRQRLLKFFR